MKFITVRYGKQLVDYRCVLNKDFLKKLESCQKTASRTCLWCKCLLKGCSCIINRHLQAYSHSSNSPLHEEGGGGGGEGGGERSTFSKLMEMWGSENFFQKKEVRQNGGLPYIEVFLEILHDAAQEKNLDVFIFPLLTSMCCKTVP